MNIRYTQDQAKFTLELLNSRLTANYQLHKDSNCTRGEVWLFPIYCWGQQRRRANGWGEIREKLEMANRNQFDSDPPLWQLKLEWIQKLDEIVNSTIELEPIISKQAIIGQ